jgi:hypothetical protein
VHIELIGTGEPEKAEVKPSVIKKEIASQELAMTSTGICDKGLWE